MILDKIVAATKARVEKQKQITPFDFLKSQVLSLAPCGRGQGEGLPFKSALLKEDISFICEVKKASPSKGIISEDFKYKDIASGYESAGADAISVLTEPDFFLGKDSYLAEIKDIVKIPVLRKDFTIDEYQIYEAKNIGADAILLICAILDLETLKRFMETAKSIGLSCLVEAHDEKEIETALKAGAEIIGVNNRNLKTFEININNSINLRKYVPADKIFVSESGIKTREDIEILRNHKIDAVLIGEELMKSGNIKEKMKELRGKN
ncbi:MAG: indole-3-glycerol phosphate synthase TrpC [Endomicrobia bacterium]|nr:indole-3-glycerol phosphate synthase TrpC [Endomicrobiia bacterium]MCL2506925.1 indole-3-glycerol phosphate synthase TrpC [Endomicrobiia bacterium]